jgi:hypothetical protein
MANLFAWILAAVWPLAKKVLVSLGIGIVTYTGLSVLAGQVQSQVVGLWGQVGGDMLSMAVLLGIPQAMGIVLGGITARISYVAAGKIGRISQ